jgi:hypothetical protein
LRTRLIKTTFISSHFHLWILLYLSVSVYMHINMSPLNNMIECVVCLAVRIWHPHPLDLTIVEILEKKGAMTDEELFDVLRETREDLGFEALNKTLMKMEVQGKIYVSSLTKGKRRVELIKRR